MKNNLAGLPSILVNKNLDIAFLQEVKLTDEQLGSQVGRLGMSAKLI